jgi:hypothetical protein
VERELGLRIGWFKRGSGRTCNDRGLVGVDVGDGDASLVFLAS